MDPDGAEATDHVVGGLSGNIRQDQITRWPHRGTRHDGKAADAAFVTQGAALRPETVRAGQLGNWLAAGTAALGTFVRAPMGTCQASCSGGRWAVKIASRLAMRLPVGCTLAA